VRPLITGPDARGLEGLARFLLRSEAMASSRIEGPQVCPQQVALAEFAQVEGGQVEGGSVRGLTQDAELVTNGIAAFGHAGAGLATTPGMAVCGLEALQRALLPGHRPPGLRTPQNWRGTVGGIPRRQSSFRLPQHTSTH
jgi:hypothetical protein